MDSVTGTHIVCERTFVYFCFSGNNKMIREPLGQTNFVELQNQEFENVEDLLEESSM